jgi:two-component system, NtrC family, response regulator PilR
MRVPAQAAEVLVIDDEPDLRTLYELTLIRAGHQVTSAATLAQARECLSEQRFDVVLTDMRLPDGLGLELLRELAQAQRSERCIVVTAYGSPENAVEALKAGAFDYLTKPVDPLQFRELVHNAWAAGARKGVSLPIAAELPRPQALDSLVGDSPSMQRVKARIQRVGKSMAPVLIYGESGTGKELAARAIHACSHRASGPFVAVNCAAIPENLLEAEFFGARKGSYTGATADREGFFQAARGGTLFLDELGDLPLAMQSKLLRAIQERKVRALGSSNEEPTDVRILSATHRDLVKMVDQRLFRQDLFFRVNVIELRLPALRDRREDLPSLCHALLSRIAGEAGQPVPALSSRAAQQLSSLPLLGNVRELENLLHRAWALHDGGALELDAGFDDDNGCLYRADVSRNSPPSASVESAVPLSATQRYSNVLLSLSRCQAIYRATWISASAPYLLLRLNALDSTAQQRLQCWVSLCGRCATESTDWALTCPPLNPSPKATKHMSVEIPQPADWQGGWWLHARWLKTPNFGERPEATAIDLIVVHSISLPPGEYGNGCVAELFTNQLDWNAHPYFETIRGLQVSAHFLIDRNGKVLQFVDADLRAWHAGQSSHRGRTGCNDFSVGIEMEGLEGGQFTETQYRALAQLCVALLMRYPIQHIAGHEHIAPGRKGDPGAGFDWPELQKRLQELEPAGTTKAWSWPPLVNLGS